MRTVILESGKVNIDRVVRSAVTTLLIMEIDHGVFDHNMINAIITTGRNRQVRRKSWLPPKGLEKMWMATTCLP